MIPGSRWENGIPPVMGAHLLPSGVVAPVSTSKGEGTGVPHMFQYHHTETDTSIMQYSDASVRGSAADS